MDYTSASLISREIGDWKYGKVEVSAKVPTGKGSWPAVWMMPTNSEYGTWPKSGEIDIMEYIGVEPDKLHFTTHFEGTGGSGHESSGTSTTDFSEPFNEFIVFSVEWTPTNISWYANGVKYHEYNKSGDYRTWPFDKEFYLILNLAYGGSWAGYDGVDDTQLPHKFFIDYVRVYQKAEIAGPYTINISASTGGTAEISPDLATYPEGTEVTLTAIPESDYEFESWKYMNSANPYTFIVHDNINVEPIFIDPSQLISNGTFDSNISEWSTYAFDANSDFSISQNNSELVATINSSPGENWKSGFQQLNLSLVQGDYVLSFDAYASTAADVLITISQNYGAYAEIVGTSQSIGTTKQTYTINLHMPNDDSNVRLFFGIGAFSAGLFAIDNISLIQVGAVTTHVVYLKKGWNIIGCPLEGETYIENALGSIYNNILTVKDMNGFYEKGQDAVLNSLKKLKYGSGYLLKVSNACELKW